MFRRTKKDVQKGRIALAFAVREALQKESPLEAAQPGWQISGEVVILVAQLSRDILHSLLYFKGRFHRPQELSAPMRLPPRVRAKASRRNPSSCR